MYYRTIVEFKKMLLNLDGCLVKAAAYADHKKFDVNQLCEARLAPDMYPFARQVQSACDSAKFCASYLSGKLAPKHEDNEKTWSELRERIKKAVAYLEGFKFEDFNQAATMKVSPNWAKGQWIIGEEFMTDISVPNFYFHLTTAYAILRHSGVDVGKGDYLGQMNLHK